MVKRSGRGRQQPHSKKPTGNQGSEKRNDDMDWNISSDEAEGEENIEWHSTTDNSEEEVNPEDLETVEERKLRLAKEYLDKVRLEEGEKDEEGGIGSSESEDDGVEERIEKRLQREADEVLSCFAFHGLGKRSYVQGSGIAAEGEAIGGGSFLQGSFGDGIVSI